MSNIFIMHASEDSVVAKDVARILNDKGHRVWIDHNELPVGSQFKNSIKQAINEVDFVIFLISKASLAKDCYCVTDELGWVLDREKRVEEENNKKPSEINNTEILLPVKLEEIPEAIFPKSIEHKLYIELYPKDKIESGMNKILKSVGKACILQNPKGFNEKDFFEKYLTFFTSEEYVKSKTQLYRWQRMYPDNYDAVYEDRFSKQQKGAVDDEVLEIHNMRRFVYQKFYNIEKEIEEHRVSIEYATKHWGESDIQLWDSVIFPLQRALKRILNSGADIPFLLFFALFYRGREKLFPESFVKFYDDPAMFPAKEEENKILHFNLLKATVKEQAAFNIYNQQLL